jgi:hypothetical protein
MKKAQEAARFFKEETQLSELVAQQVLTESNSRLNAPFWRQSLF